LLQQGYAGPRNAVEETLAGIWSELLGVERVGINDNFFELGGHSLLAIKLVSTIRKEFGAEISNVIAAITIFEYPTIKSLVDYIEEKEKVKTYEDVFSKDDLIKELGKFYE
jgi:tyrocidine synthetase-3